jgi:AcrR family transcriptional regulator
MARPQLFPAEAILDAAAGVVAEAGPSRATIGAIADRLGAPTGSIYHRFASRDVLLAELWLRTVEDFQTAFCEALAGDNARVAGLEAALHTPRYAREHAVDAQLLMLHSREEFVRGDWPETIEARATALGDQMSGAMRSFTKRATGSTGAAAMRRARFAVIHLPGAAIRPHLRARELVPADVDELVRDAYLAVIRRR